MANTLAFQLYTLQKFEGGYKAAFDAIKGLGVDTIEAWCGAVPADPDASMSMHGLRQALSDAGMKLTCGHITVGEFDQRYAEWKNLLLELGSRNWVIPFHKADNLEEWLAVLPKFREMSDRMKQDGLSLGYHNHHMELVRMGDKHVMEHLLDNMPELQAQFHIGQFLPDRGIVLADWIRKYQGRICSLHVNDSDSSGATRVGEGACRAEEAIRAAVDTGVDTFIMEVWFTKETMDGVKKDLDFVRRLIA